MIGFVFWVLLIAEVLLIYFLVGVSQFFMYNANGKSFKINLILDKL